jgi:hypothetical protein
VDITPQMMSYRECARGVWNTYFRVLDEGWHEFINVDTALLEGLVLTQVFGGFRDERSPCIWVRPRMMKNGVPAMWAHGEDRKYSFVEGRLHGGAQRLKFLEFFDWSDDSDQDFKDMNLVRCEMLESDEPSLVGAHVLLEIKLVTFEAEIAG